MSTRARKGRKWYSTAMSTLFFFTGEGVYNLREEKLRWISQFEQKYGSENIIRLDGTKTSFRELLDEAGTAPFIAPKRLIVIDGILKASKEEMKLLPQNIHENNIVLFADPKPDKRLAGTKTLLELAEVKEFKPVTGPALQSWIKATLQSLGTSIDPSARSLLLDMTGEDQDLIDQELRKLALQSTGRTITAADIEESVSPTDEGIVWKLTDMLAAGKRTEAIRYAHRIIDRGGDAYGLWAILLNLLKNAVAVFAQVKSGITDQKEISERTGLHFMAVRSLLSHARSLKKDQLRDMVRWTTEADKALKTGGYRATDEAPEELRALIDRFLLSYPS
jgi:DNA polymerase III subunit delta